MHSVSCWLFSSISKLRCFTVSVGTVHTDSIVSVVSFDIAGTLKQLIRHQKVDVMSRENWEVLAANSVGG